MLESCAYDYYDTPTCDPSWGALVTSVKNQVKSKICRTPIVFQEDLNDLVNDWVERESSVTQGNLLDIEDDQVQNVIFIFKKSLSIPCHEKLAYILLTLFDDAKEEDPDSLGISSGSIRNFYNFFQLHTNLKCPAVSLTPDYNIYASWRGEQNQLFSVHFLPDGNTRFVIFKPNSKHPGQKIRLSGRATADMLMETVAPHDIGCWVAE
ncbi:MAG: hypothetical protein KAH23_09600 [Kiritimatiellae bacterium]|nr:hypothetical protein [Kiritimatiellia bacterium]